MSNLKMFKYCWVWEKGKVGGFVSAKLRPLKLFEDVVVFSEGATANGSERNMPYYPQGLIRVNKKTRSSTDKTPTGYFRPSNKETYVQEFTNYPNQYLFFTLDKCRFHPTQKPVALFEYLIKTYTNEGETVLDNCAGSGTTAIACLNTNRKYIIMEKEKEYIDIINKRINEWVENNKETNTLFL